MIHFVKLLDLLTGCLVFFVAILSYSSFNFSLTSSMFLMTSEKKKNIYFQFLTAISALEVHQFLSDDMQISLVVACLHMHCVEVRNMLCDRD